MDGIAARVYSYKITSPPPYCKEMAIELVKGYQRSGIHDFKITKN